MEDAVFSKREFVKWYVDQLDDMPHTWVDECDGLTTEEMKELGYRTIPEWMVPRSEYRPLNSVTFGGYDDY